VIGGGAAIRCLKFTAVGGIGIVVPLIVLAFLKTVLHMHDLIATELAVEFTVLHNYIWHDQSTWVDRRASEVIRGGLEIHFDDRHQFDGRKRCSEGAFGGVWQMAFHCRLCGGKFPGSDRFVFRTKPPRFES
jgi:GtrA-like protein